ncbi:transposase [Polaribacter batillariae]|uniref:Transposase n=1 Tax=Polaribacter batillariae TaxID=2808900 RepID=A0ABX7SWZ0_9FLAO|nr:transposase [Polaribacter batillariae]
MNIFQEQNLLEFSEYFQTDGKCKEYLANIKWKNGFKCVKCNHIASQIRKDFSRTCNKCSHTETASANTLFHKVKFGLRKAFFICFEMTTAKKIAASHISTRYGVTEKTARLFMYKVREAMKVSENYLTDGTVHIDEFVIYRRAKYKPRRKL